MARDALHTKQWKHVVYDKPMKLKILKAKLSKLVKDRDGDLSVVDIALVDSAALLILTVYQHEQEFVLLDLEKPDKGYLSATNALRSTLEKLKLFQRRENESKDAPGDLADIINQ